MEEIKRVLYKIVDIIARFMPTIIAIVIVGTVVYNILVLVLVFFF